MALSRWIMEPWPAVPATVSFIQCMPFSAVWIRYRRRCSLTVKEKPPTSLIASVTPSKRSGWWSTR